MLFPFNKRFPLKTILLASLLAAGTSASAAEKLSHEDVLGKTFISSVGSSSGNFLMSVSIKAEGRNTVSVGFVSGEIAWSGPDIAAVESGTEPTHIQYAILNCKSKTYSPKPKVEDGYTFKEFHAGTKYKWGEYAGGELLSNVRADVHKSLTRYFSTVCQYTAQW